MIKELEELREKVLIDLREKLNSEPQNDVPILDYDNRTFVEEINRHVTPEIVSSFYGQEKEIRELIDYYEKLPIEDFVSLIRILVKSAWKEVGEEPVDVFREFQHMSRNHDAFSVMPFEWQIAMFRESDEDEDSVDNE